MYCRDPSKPSFADATVSGWGGGCQDRIEKAFDWLAFETLLAPIHASRRGAPGYPPLVMFEILLLQQWHTRCGTSCHSAIAQTAAGQGDAQPRLYLAFRQTVDKLGLSAALLLETNRQPDALGLKRGPRSWRRR
jgi:IS5 family transposase